MWFKTKDLIVYTFILGSTLQHGSAEGTDPATSLVIRENWELVRANCTVCHSAKGFTSVRLDRHNWQKAIKRMQSKHGLWPLGEMEAKLLDYLESNYGLPDHPYNPKIRKPLED